MRETEEKIVTKSKLETRTEQGCPRAELGSSKQKEKEKENLTDWERTRRKRMLRLLKARSSGAVMRRGCKD
jgi:hypothetical protein